MFMGYVNMVLLISFKMCFFCYLFTFPSKRVGGKPLRVCDLEPFKIFRVQQFQANKTT